jgi:adenine deaminase
MSELLAVARGDAPADLVLRGGRMVNVFTGRVEHADIAIVSGKIAGVGSGYDGRNVVDLRGAIVVPGLIDAHVHIESSLCIPRHFATALLPHGVTTAIVDPHEVANVAGIAGIRYMVESCRDLPLDAIFMAPSSVPATSLQTGGALLGAKDLASLLDDGSVHGLAEVMNYPGVVAGAEEVLEKIHIFAGRPIDGHAPGLTGSFLNAYVAAGVGSDHECTNVAEAQEKLARGLYILIREATNARNLHTLLPLITPQNSRRICFCTDDRMPTDLLTQGSIDYMVRESIAYGIDPVEAVRMATLNTAEWFQLPDRGAIAPGRMADLVVVEDLGRFIPSQVYKRGQLVSENGQMVAGAFSPTHSAAGSVRGSVNVDWDAVNFQISAQGRRVRTIGAVEDQIVTDERILDAHVDGEHAVTAPQLDLLKMAVIERHRASGEMGLGFIQGIGLKRGAMAGTIAHDHHNMVVIGADDDSMLVAARAVAEMGGGLAVANEEGVAAKLPLPVAGLMSDRPISEVRHAYEGILAAAANQGSKLHDPFMAMSFMALEVIPILKLTDRGLVNVNRFEYVDLFVQ